MQILISLTWLHGYSMLEQATKLKQRKTPTIKSVLDEHCSSCSNCHVKNSCYRPPLETITFPHRLPSALCGQFASTVGCSLGEHRFPWPPGADFSTTKPYLVVAKGNRICLPGTLSLSPALGSVHLSSLTACWTQGGMKLETPPPPIYILLS